MHSEFFNKKIKDLYIFLKNSNLEKEAVDLISATSFKKNASNEFRDWLTYDRLRDEIDAGLRNNRRFKWIMRERVGSSSDEKEIRRQKNIARRIIANIIFKEKEEADRERIMEEWRTFESESGQKEDVPLVRRQEEGVKSLLYKEDDKPSSRKQRGHNPNQMRLF